MELNPFRARRQAAIDERVREATGAAVAEVLERHQAEEAGPYRLDLPPRPRGLETQEYLDRVRDNVETMLGATTLAGTLEYDQAMEGYVNPGVLRRRHQNLFTRHYHPGLSLVFKKSQTVE
ncbi:MAG TPA: hypothetical protein VM535_01390 [Candidatus Saccharimonadales bacterium]|nr:hypothetical protein [Candidatus Saccharimonadales bacterium]